MVAWFFCLTSTTEHCWNCWNCRLSFSTRSLDRVLPMVRKVLVEVEGFTEQVPCDRPCDRPCWPWDRHFKNCRSSIFNLLYLGWDSPRFFFWDVHDVPNIWPSHAPSKAMNQWWCNFSPGGGAPNPWWRLAAGWRFAKHFLPRRRRSTEILPGWNMLKQPLCLLDWPDSHEELGWTFQYGWTWWWIYTLAFWTKNDDFP